MGYACGRAAEGFWKQNQGIDEIILERCAHNVAYLKKTNALAEVMKALKRDFSGPWDYGEVVKKIGEITHRKRVDFRKAAMAGGKKPSSIERLKWNNNTLFLFYLKFVVLECNLRNFFDVDERPVDCSTKLWVFFFKETRDHWMNPNWNAAQMNAASKRKAPRTKLWSGGKRSFAKKFVSICLPTK